MTQFPLTPKKLKSRIIRCLEKQRVPFVKGPPGVGKSAMMRDIAKEFGLKLIDVRMSQCTPEDLMGLPMRDGNRARFIPFNMFPVEGDPVPEGKNGWLLFLDEYNSCSKAVEAAGYKLVLDRMVGTLNLHENVFVVAAGNREQDKAIVNRSSTASQSRFIHFELEPNLADFKEIAIKKGYDSRVVGFLDFKPSLMSDFKPDHTGHTYACPRTWEFVSDFILGLDYDDIDLPLLAGTIGDGPAIEFHAFLKAFKDIPDFKDIRKAPSQTAVPTDTGTRYAVLTMMLDKYDKSDKGTFTDIVDYVKRFPPEMQIVYCRNISKKNPKISDHKEWSDLIGTLTDFLYDNDSDDSLEAA